MDVFIRMWNEWRSGKTSLSLKKGVIGGACVVIGGGVLYQLGVVRGLDGSPSTNPVAFQAVPDAVAETTAFEEVMGTDALESHEASSVAEPTLIYVDLKGAVAQPGMYAFEAGQRVNDAIMKAGGFTAEAAQEVINLAQVLEDQMVIQVPTKTQLEEGMSVNGIALPQSPQAAVSTPSSASPSETENALVNLNTATAAELTTLPGIGEKKAKKILEYREQYGAFQTIEDLMKVSGIGQNTFDALKDQVRVQ